jgi:hypothetical protein
MNLRPLHRSAIYALLFLAAGCTGNKLVPLKQEAVVILPAFEKIKIDSYCPFQFVDFFAKPMSYVIGKDGSVDPDSNADGLSDIQATSLGVNPQRQASTGITDYIAVEYLGIAAASLGTIPNCFNNIQATAGDLLTDCQRIALGLSIPLYDTVSRGFPDSLAVYAGVSPFNKNVGSQELAGDGMTSLQKIRQNLPVNFTATPAIKQLAVTIVTDTVVDTTAANSICYSFTVTAPRLMRPPGDVYEFYFIGTDKNGKTTLVTKGITVRPTDPSSEEYTYASL